MIGVRKEETEGELLHSRRVYSIYPLHIVCLIGGGGNVGDTSVGEILHSMRVTNTVLCVFHLLEILQGDHLYSAHLGRKEEGGRGILGIPAALLCIF